MKTLALILILFSSFSTISFAGAAGISNNWDCQGDNIEGMGVSPDKSGKLLGGVAWDCWPGGGICTQENIEVHLVASKVGNTVYRGDHFNLVIYTSEAKNSDGSYRASVSATDEQDSSDMGKGLTLGNDPATCTPSAN